MRAPIAAALALALTLPACAHNTLNSPHAILERGEIDGELAYQATMTALNGALATGKITQARHDELWRSAWADLSAFRTAYNAGQDLTASLAALRTDEATAKGAP